MSNYVLDTFAVIAYFFAEPGGEKVKELLGRAEIGFTKQPKPESLPPHE